MNLNYFYILVFLFALIGCNDGPGVEEGYRFESKEAQAYFIENLERESVSFRIDHEGMIWYPAHYQSIVDSLKAQVLETHHPGNSVIFPDNKYSKIFQSKLDDENIKYRVIFIDEKEKVVWGDEDADRVKALIEEVGDIVDRDNMAELLSNREPK